MRDVYAADVVTVAATATSLEVDRVASDDSFLLSGDDGEREARIRKAVRAGDPYTAAFYSRAVSVT